ncbi:MAG: hypothetical protein HYR88_01315 [Verrucomicrobia bacterium]|nr:hypothetical protein [Verrucomicrobiota bacterium]MBI3868203.1 hypothetical protein [Verrucomicrobiota bacterium]
MNARFKKDFHLARTPILASWIAQAALVLLERSKPSTSVRAGTFSGSEMLIPFILWITAAYLGVLFFSHEFDHQTLTARLLEPRSRRSVWWGKVATAFAWLLVFQLGTLGICGWAKIIDTTESVWFMTFFPVTALLSGPLCALITRNTATSAALCVLGQMLCLLATALYFSYWHTGYAGEPDFDMSVFTAIGGGYGVLCLGVGRFRWSRWELKSDSSFALPRNQSAMGASLFRRVFPTHGASSRAQLWRRELLLQPRTILIGVALCLLAAVDQFLMRQLPMGEVPEALFPALLLLPSAVVPLLAGVTLGVERNTGTDFLSATQPITANQLFRTRLAVGSGLCLLLGVLLPFALSSLTQSYASHSWNGDLILMSATTCLFFCLAWFGSVVGSDPRRAMLLAAALPALVIGALAQVHGWVTPWIASHLGPRRMNIGFLSSSGWLFGRTPFSSRESLIQAAALAFGLLVFCALCLHWIQRHGRFHHLPKAQVARSFGKWLGILLAMNAAVGVWSMLKG